MRFMIEVVADNRQDAATLLRDAATKIKHGKEQPGEQESSCIGDYRVIALGSPLVSYKTEKLCTCRPVKGTNVTEGRVRCPKHGRKTNTR